jgi:hypothetical protein
MRYLSLVAVLLLGACLFYIDYLQETNTRLKSNQEILLNENLIITAESQKYKVADSLNAIRISGLELTLKEYKRYRSEDLKLIKQLKTKKSDLQKVIDSQVETIKALSAKLNDSIRIDTITNRIDTLKCFNYKSKWTDVKGCVDLYNDSVHLQVNNREALKIVETVTYKRFLGFLWKTNKIKSRQIEVVSENPATQIIEATYVNISH